MFERVATGISGLDAIIEGGLPKGRTYVVTGHAGSGKTILATQFLYNGIYKFSEKGLYVSFEESSNDISDNLSRFNWNLDPYLKDDSFKLLCMPFFQPETDSKKRFLKIITEEIKKNNYTRLVLDSLPAIELLYQDSNNLRKELFEMFQEIRELGCTTIIISEKTSGTIGLTHFGIEDFLSHGLIVMHLSHTYRGIEVRKMRGTSHNTDIHRLKISDNGITVYAGDHPY